MGPAGLPTVRPEHVLNCSPPSPGGCGSGFKATGPDSRGPPPPSPVDMPHVARWGRYGGRGSLHCGAHRASGGGAGRSHEMVGFLFASAGFTQFSLGSFFVSCFLGSPPWAQAPHFLPLAFVALPSPRHARTHVASSPRPLARVGQWRIRPSWWQ